jgi:hypothetical protein
MRSVSATVLFSIAAFAADRAEVTPPSPAVSRVSPVLRPQEPDDNRFVTLPGLPAPPPRELKDFTPPPPPPLPQAQLPAAPAAAMAITPVAPKLTALPEERPILRRAPAPKPVFPPDFERDSASYCQQRIGAWSEPDVYNLFGKPLRRRVAGGDGKEAGLVFAFADPTGKYRELELDFAADTGLLRSVFVYPWQMTWSEAQRQWGTNVTSAQANKGRTFYSYLNRRLDVLVDSEGKIISLGLY